MSELTHYEGQLRGVERVFEDAFKRIQLFDSSENLISTQVRNEAMVERFSIGFNQDVEYSEKYSRCITFLNTLCASLSSKKVGDVTEEQIEAMRHVYRFVTGPVRECAYKLDQESNAQVTAIEIERLEAEMYDMSSLVRDVDILTSEHTYS